MPQIGHMNSLNPGLSLANVSPLAQLRAGRLLERLVRLVLGLALYGLAIALMIRGALGAAPWDVFHQGLARHLPGSLGLIMVLTSAGVLVAWIPLRQLPGLGTVVNTLLIGPFTDAALRLLATPDGLVLRLAQTVLGVALCGVATAMYVGAQLGPGPRDGLMTGLAYHTGWSIRRIRTLLEATVLAAGLLLGSAVGAGTMLFALAIGPLTQYFLRYLVVPVHAATHPTGEENLNECCNEAP
jgi:uncharacterized membrane protein YczE